MYFIIAACLGLVIAYNVGKAIKENNKIRAALKRQLKPGAKWVDIDWEKEIVEVVKLSSSGNKVKYVVLDNDKRYKRTMPIDTFISNYKPYEEVEEEKEEEETTSTPVQ